jgi:hypothetical protein
LRHPSYQKFHIEPHRICNATNWWLRQSQFTVSQGYSTYWGKR